MTTTTKWHVGLLAGTLALGMTWAGVRTARAQDQNADGQQAAQQEGRRNRGQGRGQGGPGGPGGGLFGARNPVQAVEQYQTQVKELNLTDDQKAKLDAIFKDSAERAKTLAAEVENLQGQERAQKVMPFQREMRDKVLGVLTDEQKQTLRKNMATRQARQMTERYRRATADLGLSDDQKTKVEAVLTDSEKKFAEAIAQAPSPGEGGVGGPGGGIARGGPFREINQTTRDKVNEILTPEQQEKLRASMGRGQGQGQGQGQGGRGRRGQGQGQNQGGQQQN
jgi:Spy/CpxP family protein refolding chaperone